MPHTPPKTSGPAGSHEAGSLTDRVAARVIDARLALEQRAGGSRPKARRGRPMTAPALNDPTAAGEQREAASLRRVFREMGISYRRYRRQTGGPVVPGLRDAAYRFREDPSLTSLVAVAAFLDELDLLS
jgi:hypothetical protein